MSGRMICVPYFVLLAELPICTDGFKITRSKQHFKFEHACHMIKLCEALAAIFIHSVPKDILVVCQLSLNDAS